MRILHTSDWHLGRAFHGVGMLEHQAAYVDHLIETVAAEQVDLVVVSGDIYDRGLPAVDAVQIADEAMRRLAASRARAVIISGNHDSARRLGFASGLIDAAGVHLRTDAAHVATPVLLDDVDGPVAVYGIPYLDPDITRRAWQLESRSHQATLTAAMQRIREDLARQPKGSRSIVLAHAFVAGGLPSDSERDIAVGGVSRVPTTIFEGIDYTALGHLHGQQVLSNSIRYSGSPLAYSFSESSHTKGSWLVDLQGRSVDAEFIPAPVPRRLARISGSLDELLADARHVSVEDSWLQITLTDAVRPRSPMEQLRARFPHTLALQFSPVGGAARQSRPTVNGRSDLDIALDFVNHVRGSAADPDEAVLLRQAVESCCGVADADVQVGVVS